MGHNQTVHMDYIIFIMIAAVASIVATLVLTLACNRLDKTLLEMELQSLRDDFNFKLNNN